MARGPSTFKINDVTRAITAARKAGLNPVAVEVASDGRIKVIGGRSGDAPPFAADSDTVRS
jgi:hypothetical protein